VLRSNGSLFAAQYCRSLDDIAQLADISWPAVRMQGVDRSGRKYLDPAMLTYGFGETLSRDYGDVVLTFAEWRQRNGENVQTIQQILAEGASSHGLLEEGVCCRDDATPDREFFGAAEQTHAARLEHPQKLGLERHRQVVDLVEKERAFTRELEQSTFAPSRVGESTTLMTEQLRLQQRLWNRGAVHRHERLLRGRSGIVNSAREQLLAGAGLAKQQHGRSRRIGHALRKPQGLDDGRTATQDVLKSEVG
jgi:hypothetical protein